MGWGWGRDNKQDKTRKGGQVPEHLASEEGGSKEPCYPCELDTYLAGPLLKVIVILIGFLNGGPSHISLLSRTLF